MDGLDEMDEVPWHEQCYFLTQKDFDELREAHAAVVAMMLACCGDQGGEEASGSFCCENRRCLEQVCAKIGRMLDCVCWKYVRRAW